MNNLLTRIFTASAISFGIATTAAAQTRLGTTANVGGGVKLVEDQKVLYYAVGGSEWLSSAPSWAPKNVSTLSFHADSVYDAKRQQLVTIKANALTRLVYSSGTGQWALQTIPSQNSPDKPSFGVSIDMRDSSSDVRKAPIYYRAINGFIYVYLWEPNTSLPGNPLMPVTRMVSNIPGGPPVFDNFNTSETRLFFVDSYFHLQESVYNPSTKVWTTYQIANGPISGQLIVNASKSVVYIDFNHRIASTWWTGSFWTTANWNLTSNAYGSLVRGADQGTVAYTDQNANIWKCSWGGSGFVSTQLTFDKNAWYDTLAVNSLGDIFYRGKDNYLWKLQH